MKYVDVKVANHREWDKPKNGKDFIEGALKAIFMANGANVEDEKVKLNIKKMANSIDENFADYHDAIDLLGNIQSAIIVNKEDSNPLKHLWDGFACGKDKDDDSDSKDECEGCGYMTDDETEELISTMDFVMATKTFNSLLEYYSTDDEDVLLDADFCINNFIKSMEVFNKLFRFYINH